MHFTSTSDIEKSLSISNKIQLFLLRRFTKDQWCTDKDSKVKSNQIISIFGKITKASN